MADLKLDGWFDPHGYHNGKALQYREGWLVGQMFFHTDRSKLNSDDFKTLDMIYTVYGGVGMLGGAPQHFHFVGYADIRGTVGHNFALALSRAEAVKSYVDGEFRRWSSYASHSKSRGKEYASRTRLVQVLAGDRRVDIFAPYRTESKIKVPVASVIAKYTGTLSHKYKFRTLAGGGVGRSVVGAQVFTIEIMNSRTQKRAFYTYTGVGIGIGFQINRPTDWSEQELKDVSGNDVWLDLDDFEGPGKVASAGVGYQKAVWIFRGPKERGVTADSVFVDASGVDVAAGVSVDIKGHWHKQ